MEPRATRPENLVAGSLRRLRSAVAPQAKESTLSTCVACRRDFVVPVQWEPVGDERWWIFVRCAECGLSREVIVPNADAEAYDKQLAVGAKAVAHAVASLDLRQMADGASAFAAALEHGVIGPADFAR